MSEFVTWSSDFSTGIELVDRQHRGLVDTINEIAPLLAATGEHRLAEITPIYQRLMDYAATHFHTEEDLMAEWGVDRRVQDHHHQTHARFVDKVQAMTQEYLAGGSVTGTALFSFLASWLVDHILGEDQTMARQIAAIRGGAAPEQAYLDAGGAYRYPAKETLGRVMVNCYALISEQNQSLQRLSDHLLGIVAERTAHLEAMNEDLKRARDAAEAANRAKARFLGTVSHELRTPMNAIIGFAEALHREGLPPPSDALAGNIKAAADQLLHMIDDILEFSRGEAGETAPFELRALLSQACEAPFARARSKGLAVKLTIDPALPAAFLGDARRLSLVLRVLADNAAKFTRQGSIQVRVIDIPEPGDETEQRRLRFEVRDTGSGIPKKRQAELFEALHQLDNSTARQHGGLGIGLSVARQAVRMMQGEIGLDSHPGDGCTFWFTLRLTPTKLPDMRVTENLNTAKAPDVPPTRVAMGEPSCVKATTLQRLDQLEQFLRISDTRACTLFEEVAHCLRSLPGNHCDELADQIANFEFDRALPAVHALRQQLQETAHD
jgi:hemerythrin-like metal-binding protein